MIKECIVCNKEFESIRIKQKIYCSKKCNDKDYRDNNKEKYREYGKKYRDNNKLKLSKSKKIYRLKNIDKIKVKIKIWNINNKEKIKTNSKKYSKIYRDNNKEKLKENSKIWRDNNKEKLKEYSKNYGLNNRNKIREWQTKHRKENKEHYNKYNLKYYKIPENKIIRSLRKRVYNAIKYNNKSKPTLKLLGCTTGFLKEHLESQFTFGMNWKNYGYGWHIDHIRPCASFDLSKPEEQKKCFHYTNLQPLWAIENIRKSDKYDKKETIC